MIFGRFGILTLTVYWVGGSAMQNFVDAEWHLTIKSPTTLTALLIVSVRRFTSRKLFSFRSLEAVEDIIYSNSADGGKYPNYIYDM